MLGHHRHASKTPFKWRFSGGPMFAGILCYLDPLSSHHLKTQKNVVKAGPPLAKLSEPHMRVTLITSHLQKIDHRKLNKT